MAIEARRIRGEKLRNISTEKGMLDLLRGREKIGSKMIMSSISGSR